MSGSEGILSTDEIAALVEAAKRGDISAGAAPAMRRRGPRVRDIDFTRPKKFSQEQQKKIERAHEAFCRAVAARLSAELRTNIEIELINLDQLTWSTAVTEIPSPSLFAVLRTDPLDTRVLLSAELALVMRIVELLLGGDSGSKPVSREPTEIETTLARRTIAVLVDQLSLTWDELLGLRLSVEALEANLGNVQLAPVSEPSLGFTFEIRVGKASATLSLTVPHMAIEPVVPRLGGAGFEEERHDEVNLPRMVAALEPVEIELRAEVAAVSMPIEDVLAIRPGDVVRLGAAADTGVMIYANATPAYLARPGRAGRHRAVQVTGRIAGDPT